jgi:predicted nucleic acid-binding protein
VGSNPTPTTEEETPILIVDSGAVIALARGDKRVRLLLEAAIDEGLATIVPPVVIAETTRGGPRDAPVNQVLKTFDVVSTIDGEIGRTAGRLLGRAASEATMDALIVATAIALGGGRIVTGDVDDLRALATDNPEVTVHGI